MHIKNKKRFLIFGSLIVVLAITAFFYFHSKSGKVILIGLDGADWDIIDHFIQEGKLPHFKRFKTEGAFGYLKSFSPMLSPVLWTTIATGKSADEHGIVDFLEWNEDQKTRIPVMSNRIQVRTLWDILGDEGFSVGVFNWLVSWPAQPVNGVLVSDRLSYHIFPRIVGDRLTIDKLSWPQDYVVSRQHLLASPSGITYEESKPFIHIRREEFEKSYETGKYDIKNPQYNLRMILSSIKTMSRLALEKIETDQPHFLAFYLDAPDTMMHTYMDYAPPKLDRVSKEDFEKYKDAVGQTYVYLDQILGDFLRVAHPNTSFVLISDHGFKFKDERLNTSAAIGENAEERWHDEHGIIAFLGPQFSIGKEIKGYDLYDVAPTLLYLMDQPLAQDMKGQIMSSAFKQEQFDIEKISYIASYERGKKKDQPPPIRSSSDDTLKEKLVSLGYVNQGELVNIDESKEKKTLKSHFDTRNPLLEAYHLEESGKTQEATAAYEKILQENPGYNKAYVVHNQLSLLYKEKKSFRLALNHIQEAIALKPELSSLYVNQGNILRDFNRSKKAVKAYEKALSINAKDPMAHYNLGFLYEKQKNWHKAQEEYRKAFDLNPKFS
ncbi:MAG: alkaline phosphatase family protein [Deltaproteobacteria bacterium]|nr:alkaline phosphatase family protein [Deltaproteobacteria bacterium]